jgi:hypothetical protein
MKVFWTSLVIGILIGMSSSYLLGFNLIQVIHVLYVFSQFNK